MGQKAREIDRLDQPGGGARARAQRAEGWEVAVEITVSGRNLGVTDRFREYAIEKVITGQIPIQASEPEEEEYSPVVIRDKVFPTTHMTKADALDHMELVGHDFFLFIDSETDRPSVVYRRKGWDYGVISLEDEAGELPKISARGRSRGR